MITAVVVMLVTFFCFSFLFSSVALIILLLQGRLTLPRTNARRLMHAQASLDVAKLELDREVVRMRIDDMLSARLQRQQQITTGGEEK